MIVRYAKNLGVWNSRRHLGNVENISTILTQATDNPCIQTLISDELHAAALVATG